MKKLICVDIDGTVLNHNGDINPQVFELFKNEDYKFIIASGRPLGEIRGFGFDGDCVGSNGGEIVKDGKLVKRATLDNQVIIELYKFFVDNFANVTVSTDKGRYLNDCIDIDQIVRDMVIAFNGHFDQRVYDKISREMRKCGGYISDIEQFVNSDIEISKLECSTMDKTNILLEEYGHRNDISVFTSIGGHIEIVPPNVNKATAIKQYIGDDEYEVFAIGDGNNDIEMFELADVSFAMGNGTDQLKQVATHQVADIWNDGFLEAVERIYSGQY